MLLALSPEAAVGSRVNTAGRLRSAIESEVKHAGRSFIRTVDFKHRLRICNAYPDTETLDVFWKKQKVTGVAMPYKQCREFTGPLQAGDKLQFEVGGVSAGSFKVADLPNSDAVLVLVIFRHDTVNATVKFESHVFASLVNAQIAVLDTYQGKKKTVPFIRDISAERTARSEELTFDSIVAVNPGMYEVVLQSDSGETQAKRQLVALNRESYVALRCGVEAQVGPSYPEELIVFPLSDKMALLGSSLARRLSLSIALFAAVLSAMS